MRPHPRHWSKTLSPKSGCKAIQPLPCKTLQDKYTGPLGAASLDSALLTVLYHGRASRGPPKNVIFMEKSQMLFSNVKEDVKRKLFLVHIRRSERVKSTCFPDALTIWDFFGPKITGLPETVLWSMRTAVSRLITVSVCEVCWVQRKVNVMLCFIMFHNMDGCSGISTSIGWLDWHDIFTFFCLRHLVPKFPIHFFAKALHRHLTDGTAGWNDPFVNWSCCMPRSKSRL